MSRLPVHQLRTNAKELDLGDAKVYHLPDWHALSHPQRLVVIRQIATMRGRDPRLAKVSVSACRKAGVRPREYDKQAAALLKWVQNPDNVYYVNEPGERLQDPIYTINAKHGDCDDQVLLLCALFESVRLPWRLVLSGRDSQGQKIRHIEGAAVPGGCTWTHIYCMVGTPPFNPTRWYFCETTVEGVPLGWDVVSGDHAYLPEMMKKPRHPPQIVSAPSAPFGFRPSRSNGSPAHAEAWGDVSSAVGASLAEELDEPGVVDWKKIAGAVATGVAVSVFTQVALDWVRGSGTFAGSPPLPLRIQKTVSPLQNSFFIYRS